MMVKIAEKLGKWSPFSTNPRDLFSTADKTLPRFVGGNGRYCWAKLVDMGNAVSALLAIAPRYENTATVLDLMGISGSGTVPLFTLSFDGDWDETAWTSLRSFLHYCSYHPDSEKNRGESLTRHPRPVSGVSREQIRLPASPNAVFPSHTLGNLTFL